MTNTEKLAAGLYIAAHAETEKQALMQGARTLGAKGLGYMQQAFSGGAPAIANRFKNLGLGAKEGLRDTGNFLGGLAGKNKLFGESVTQPGRAFNMGRQIAPVAMGAGFAAEGARQINNGVNNTISSYNGKLREEGRQQGMAEGAQGVQDKFNNQGYFQNLMHAIMNKPMPQ